MARVRLCVCGSWFVGREGQAAHPRAPGQCLHFECRGAPARVRVWRCEGRPPLPHHFVCVEKFTLPYLTTRHALRLACSNRDRLASLRPRPSKRVYDLVREYVSKPKRGVCTRPAPWPQPRHEPRCGTPSASFHAAVFPRRPSTGYASLRGLPDAQSFHAITSSPVV